MTDTISSFHTNYTEKILEDRKREDKQVSQSIRSTKALRGKQENNSDDPFSKSDLNCRLVCIYDRITGEKRGFAKIIFLNSVICFSSLKHVEEYNVFPGEKESFARVFYQSIFFSICEGSCKKKPVIHFSLFRQRL